MGLVYRALDEATGDTVAVKVLHPGQTGERFLREAAVLSTLAHPAIVRYVAHGETERGRLYLAMEWLAGRTLSEHLAERPLTIKETLTVAARVASGLAAAHREGVVHRDVKPSNVFVVNGSLADAKLIDFGVARRRLDPHFTEAGLLIGTLAYMSPEQASGDRNPEPASDVFSLGSLLYRAVSGEHPFKGGDATVILAKVLLDEPAPLSRLVPNIPAPFEQLLTDMLHKRPDDRPANAAAVEARLRSMSIGNISEPPPAALGSEERRAVWVALVGGGEPEDTETRELRLSQPELAPNTRAAAMVASHGGSWHVLADGTGVATFFVTETDHGAAAARAAMALVALFGDRPLALSLGLGVVGQRGPIGSALDRAVTTLAGARPGEVRVDAETARVLGPRRTVRTSDGRHRLGSESTPPDTARLFLGRATEFVGRERELVALEALYDECASEPVARAALVLGDAGVGKSRLRYELALRLTEHELPSTVLLGRSDSLSAGNPFGLLRHALRRSAELFDGEPAELSREKLLRRVTRSMGDSDHAREVVAFLGELSGVPFPLSFAEALAPARADATRMGDGIRGAWLDFVAAECGARPLVILLEDLHWGDRPSVNLIDAALAAHPELPLLVIAFARPTVDETLTKPWVERGAQTLRLRPLHRGAATQLSRSVLGASATEETIARIVDLADGNAFFLEELIRTVADGHSELPASVVGMVQNRLDTLPTNARRILRAASVFGMRFWQSGAEHLTGQHHDAAALEELAGRELVSRRPQSAFPGQAEYAFRHSMVREAAYATLTEEDRALGHRMAGEWLERAGEVESLVLAEHYRRGGELPRAAHFYAAAAERALEGHDLTATLERAELALTCGPDAALRGRLRQLAAQAHLWRGEYLQGERAAEEAARLLERGSTSWFSALSDACSCSSSLEHGDALANAAELAADATALDEDARAAQIMCLSRAASGYLKAGRRADAARLVEKMDALCPAVRSLSATAWTHHARSAVAYFAGEQSAFRKELSSALSAFDATGETRAATNTRVNLGFMEMTLGNYETAESLLRQALATTERLGLASVRAYALHNLGHIRAECGAPAEAIALQRQAIAIAERHGEGILEGSARAYLALAACRDGQLSLAETESRRASKILEKIPGLLPLALATLARVLLARGSAAAALAEARRAHDLAGEHGTPEDTESLVALVLAQAQLENGLESDARRTLEHGARSLLRRAERVGEKNVLERVSDNAELLALARAHGAA